jgi:lysozyme family protein
MSRFDNAVELIFTFEGGSKYTNDPQDPGGETKYGISKRAFPNLDIKNLTLDEAKKIYKERYWDKIQGDALPYHVALPVFDLAVNAGVGLASMMLQECLPGIMVDGQIGPKTVKAANEIDKLTFISKYTKERIMFYASLKGFPRYGNGWVSRAISTLLLAMKG